METSVPSRFFVSFSCLVTFPSTPFVRFFCDLGSLETKSLFFLDSVPSSFCQPFSSTRGRNPDRSSYSFLSLPAMTRFSSLLAACLVAPLALASPFVSHQDGKAGGSGAQIVRNVPEPVVHRDGRLVSREPGAPMVRRNGLVARTDTRSVSLEQTLENEPLFNR